MGSQSDGNNWAPMIDPAPALFFFSLSVRVVFMADQTFWRLAFLDILSVL
jgi:hypothetical protein